MRSASRKALLDAKNTAYQKQKSLEKRASETDKVQCICCSINGTCVGIVGVILLFALGAALLSFPGAGRMAETVGILIKNRTQFLAQYNDDPYDYEFRVLKHIRSYTRYTFIRKPDIPRTYVSITFNLGWFDDHLSLDPGIIKIMFDRLPYESYFKRDPNDSTFLKLVLQSGGSYALEVGPVLTELKLTIPNDKLELLLREFNQYFGFGRVSNVRFPGNEQDRMSYARDLTFNERDFDHTIELMPARPAFFPRRYVRRFLP